MKAVLKTGKTVDIDTSFLANNQYNTVDRQRIFDGEILAIIDDARVGRGVCKYCGATVNRGEEEKHFAEVEEKIKSCDGCFWDRKKCVCKNEISSDTQVEELPGGRLKETRTVTTEYIMQPYCEHEVKYGHCVHEECRSYGINWFVPENTFFLKYPNGFDEIQVDAEHLVKCGFEKPYTRNLDTGTVWWDFAKKIGSYSMEAVVEYVDGAPLRVERFDLANCRKRFSLRYEEGDWYSEEYRYGWRKLDKLDVPNDVRDAVQKIICRVMNREV